MNYLQGIRLALNELKTQKINGRITEEEYNFALRALHKDYKEYQKRSLELESCQYLNNIAINKQLDHLSF